MNMEISRRNFLKGAGAGVAATTLGAFGFSEAEAAFVEGLRAYKLAGTTETRNTCPYCSVACGVIIYSKGDLEQGTAQAMHLEGDVDHPTNRGTLCPKGAALLDFIKADTRLLNPKVRRPGSDQFEEISWDEAIEGIARHMKTDRDANFIERNMDGVSVNRWTTTGFLAASATTNETAFLTYKTVRSTGMVAFDNQARV
jgi:formate dehydrogenase major subunit